MKDEDFRRHQTQADGDTNSCDAGGDDYVITEES